jgi:hypothetical protein
VNPLSGYRTASEDTSFEAEQLILEAARRRTPKQKLARVRAMTEYVHNLAFAAYGEFREDHAR